MGIMDIFKQAISPAAPAGAQPPTTNMGSPGNIPPTGLDNGGTAFGSGTAPNGAVPAGAADAPKNPLDEFSKLWENDPDAIAKPNDPYFNVNMEALTKAAGSQNFLTSVTQEQLASVAKGGPEAVKAFATVLQNVSQDIYARSAFAASKIAESGLLKAEGKMRAEVPGIIKSHGLRNSLLEENPAFSHPAAQPLIFAVQQQLTLKHPNASESELRGMAIQYLAAFNQAATKLEVTGSKSGGAAASTEDWEAFLK